MRIRRYDFNGIDEFNGVGNNAVTVIKEERKNGKWMCIDCLTECKRPKTAAKRLFSVLTWEETHEELSWRLEDVEELIENECFKLYEENEFSFGCEETDNGWWYIYLNVRTAPNEDEVEEAVAEAVAEEIAKETEDQTPTEEETAENSDFQESTDYILGEKHDSYLGFSWDEEEEDEEPTEEEDFPTVEEMEETTEDRLKRTCDAIRDELETVYNGDMVADEDGCVDGTDYGLCEGDSVDFWSFFTEPSNEVYDVAYTVGGDGEYRGVRLMVACGGPNIYIDTNRGIVEGCWWTDHAESWLPSEVCEEIDLVWSDFYQMMIG